MHKEIKQCIHCQHIYHCNHVRRLDETDNNNASSNSTIEMFHGCPDYKRDCYLWHKYNNTL